jgi:hypothetical protein
MALSVAAGTETLHGYSFGLLDGTQDLIFGAQHHIYTVLSIIAYCRAIGTAGDTATIQILGNNNHITGTAQTMIIANYVCVATETFVWNDKFSFNGFETAAYTEPLSDNAEQLLQAAQGSSVPQRLQITTTDADVDLDVHVTFIDQNNN